MSKTFLITKEFQETRVAILQDRDLKDYHVERTTDKGIFGNVYKGKVETIIPGMQAAFVDIGLRTNGFLHASVITHSIYEYDEVLEGKDIFTGKNENVDITQLLKSGQDVLVQIIREPINSKGPRLTTHISLPGRYIVLMPFDRHIGISRRIEDRGKRKYLRSVIEKLEIPRDMGLIVRTFAGTAGERDIVREYKYLYKQWNNLDRRARTSKAPALIYEERDLVLRVMRDMVNEDVSQVFLDSKVEYKRSMHFLKKIDRKMRSKVRYYRNDKPIFDSFGIQEEIEKIYERKVKLKGGGYIVIEPTESLVAIDVNSGGYLGKKDLEDTAFYVNMQAVEEIMKQIKLRDLGGIIIVDFIDMNKSQNIKSLLNKVGSLLKADKSETDFWYSPKVGLLEITRQRSRKSIKSISYQECPYCEGRGMVKSPSTVAIYAIRKIKSILGSRRRVKQIKVKLHPDVIKVLNEKFTSEIRKLEYQKKMKLKLVENHHFHIEQVEFED